MRVFLAVLLLATAAQGAPVAPVSSEGCDCAQGVAPENLTWYLTPEEMALYEPIKLSPRPQLQSVPRERVAVGHRPQLRAPLPGAPAGALDVPEGRGPGVRFDRITDTASYPWSAVTKLYMTFPNGERRVCSGAIALHEQIVFTAGHCIYNAARGGFASEVVIIPGMDGSYQPYGQLLSTSIYTWNNWIDFEDPTSDVAWMTMSHAPGTGWFGTWGRFPGEWMGETLNVAGYPSYFQSGVEMFYEAADIYDARLNQLTYQGSHEPGSSGSPSWYRSESGRWITGTLTLAELDASGAPISPGGRVITNHNGNEHYAASCLALEEGYTFPLDIATPDIWQSFQSVQVAVEKQGYVNNCIDLYAVLELAGQFYYFPSLGFAPETVTTDATGSSTMLLDVSLGQVAGTATIGIHTAAVHSDTGQVVSNPPVASKYVTLMP